MKKRQTLIALEGVDGAGKSSILNALSTHDQNIVIQSSMPELLHSTKEYYECHADLLSKFLFFMTSIRTALHEVEHTVSNSVFFDRYRGSLYAYHKVFNNLTIDSFHSFLEPFDKWIPCEDFMVLLECDTHINLERIKNKTKISKTEEIILNDSSVIDRIIDAYEEYHSSLSNVVLLRFNTTHDSIDYIVENILSKIKKGGLT